MFNSWAFMLNKKHELPLIYHKLFINSKVGQ